VSRGAGGGADGHEALKQKRSEAGRRAAATRKRNREQTLREEAADVASGADKVQGSCLAPNGGNPRQRFICALIWTGMPGTWSSVYQRPLKRRSIVLAVGARGLLSECRHDASCCGQCAFAVKSGLREAWPPAQPMLPSYWLPGCAGCAAWLSVWLND
jgi:hypothetical protein